jgi:hypothetical protein
MLIVSKRQATSTSATSVFTAQERSGDFSELLQQAKPIQLYDPHAIVNGQRVPFAGNKIPANLLDPVSLNIVNASVYPLPTSPRVAQQLPVHDPHSNQWRSGRCESRLECVGEKPDIWPVLAKSG